MVTICYVCGDRGFSRALIYCNRCQSSAVHQYCLLSFPATFDDYAAWVCDDCESKQEPVNFIVSDSLLLGKDDSIDTEYRQASANEINEDDVPIKRLKKIKKIGIRCRKANSSQIDLEDIPINRLKKNEKKRINKIRETSPSLEPSHLQPGENNEKNSKSVAQDSLVLADRGNFDEGAGVVEVVQSARSDHSLDDKIGKEKGTEKKRHILDDRVNRTEEAKLVKARHSVRTGTENCVKGQKSERQQVSDLGFREKFSEETELGKLRQYDGENTERDQEIECRPQKRLAMEGRENFNGRTEPVDGPLNMLQQGPLHAQPIVEPIWKGRFKLCNEKYGAFDGLAAYVSSLACTKVHDEARLLPGLLLLDLLPRSYVWPKGFERSPPSDQSIALYFFPDNERAEKTFDSLVDDMVDRHLAMRAIVKNAELLIFTSTELPLEYWRFQAKLYLWGVFRKKQASSSSMTVKWVDKDQTK